MDTLVSVTGFVGLAMSCAGVGATVLCLRAINRTRRLVGTVGDITIESGELIVDRLARHQRVALHNARTLGLSLGHAIDVSHSIARQQLSAPELEALEIEPRPVDLSRF